jgi:hypothetical protein
LLFNVNEVFSVISWREQDEMMMSACTRPKSLA